MNLVVTDIGQLVTNDETRGALLGLVSGAAVAIEGALIAWIGDTGDIPTRYATFETLSADGGAVLPGFVDAHTHAVFAGDRAGEFSARLSGARYDELLADGGGIYSTIAATRSASVDELVEASLPRVARMLKSGTTTVEIKTGYGLDIQSETKILDAIDCIREALPIDVVASFLGAHVVAPEFKDDVAGYVDLVAGDMLDAVADRVAFVDVFCDDNAFTVDETCRIVDAARARGLAVRLHVDQFSRSGGTALAAEVGATAADHLDHATDEDLAALADSGAVAVLLPGVSYSMRIPAPDGRRVWDSGVRVAIATDCNPGTSYIETMPFIISLAAITSGLTVEEAIWAATRGGALALNLPDRGLLAEGRRADLVILDAPTYTHLAYRPDGDIVTQVITAGTPL